jgi:hypothetical protein
MLLGGTVLVVFFLGCIGMAYFVYWLVKQGGSAKSTNAK